MPNAYLPIWHFQFQAFWSSLRVMASHVVLFQPRGRKTPPYIGFRAFLDLIAYLKDAGCPERIDHAVDKSQMITALRLLGLIDTLRRPTDELKRLVAVHGTSSWTAALQQMLRHTYAPILERDLTRISSKDFLASFKAAFPAADDVTRKCIAFFLHAAREAQMPINLAITANLKPRLTSGRSKRRTVTRSFGTKAAKAPAEARAKLHMFVEMFDRNALPDDEQHAFDVLLGFLQTEMKTGGGT